MTADELAKKAGLQFEPGLRKCDIDVGRVGERWKIGKINVADGFPIGYTSGSADYSLSQLEAILAKMKELE